MNRRPTPETDKAKCKFTSLLGDDEDAYWVPLKVARRLESERDAERALADRLADALEGIWPFIEEDIPHGCNSTGYMNAIELCRANITEWKEVRND